MKLLLHASLHEGVDGS